MNLYKDFEISNNEIKSIEQFRHTKNTSVLTIMFTDIKGFTAITDEKGEIYSNKFRKTHDNILQEIIEENNSGIIIKNIGDAFLAIFSEPTIAVEKAIKIQDKLRNFNKLTNKFDNNIEVKIGIHMGQVAIEDNFNTDIFGNHVNKCSRIESAADGNQIYLSHSVFDSAKGWLLGQNIDWKLHGEFFLKGFKFPERIYEVYNSNHYKPSPPKNIKKKSSIPQPIVLISTIFVTIILTLASINIIQNFNSTEVIFKNVYRCLSRKMSLFFKQLA